MKITADTNILISATFWYGDSNEIIGMVEKGRIELVLSKDIIEEFAEVLNSEEIQEKIRNKNLEMKETLQKIVSLSEIVEPKMKLQIVQRDPDDNKVLECAIEGKVNYIISSDKHLLTIKAFENIRIVSPGEFLDLIR